MKLPSLILLSLWGVASGETITYDDHIQDLFGTHCSKCHSDEKKKGGLNLMTYTGLMAGGGSGASVVAGKPNDSLLMLTMTHEEEPTMPPKSDKLPKAKLDLVRAFIQQGLKETGTSKALVAKKEAILDLSGGAGTKFEGPGVLPKTKLTKEVNLSIRGNSTIALAHSPRASLVAIGGLEQVLLYNSDTNEFLGAWPFKEGTIRELRFTPNGKVLVASGGQDGASGLIVAWDVEKSKRILEVGKEFETLMAASLSSDLQNYSSSAASTGFKISSVSDKNDFEKIKKHTNWVSAISYSPDGILLATGDRDGTLYVWESHSRQRLYSLTGHKEKITRMSWRPDSNLLLTASEDGQVMIWNMMNGRVLKSWKAHNDGVLSVDISVKGQVATAGRDNLVKLWDSNGKLQKTIKGFPDLPLSVKYNHNGEKILTGDWLGNVKAWNVADIKETNSYASFYAKPYKPAVLPVAKKEVKPATKAVAKKMDKPKPAPVAKKEVKPAPKAVAKKMDKPKPAPVAKKETKPAPKAVAKKETKATSKPVAKKDAKPADKKKAPVVPVKQSKPSKPKAETKHKSVSAPTQQNSNNLAAK